MDMRERWACPDLEVKKSDGMFNPVPGSAFEFDDCPAYYLREAWMDMPAEHLLDDGTHVASLINDWAFEIESGARNVDTLSTKAREGVHLCLRERSSRNKHLFQIRKDKAKS